MNDPNSVLSQFVENVPVNNKREITGLNPVYSFSIYAIKRLKVIPALIHTF